MGLMLIKAKLLSTTSAVQTDIDPWNLSAPPQAFPLHWQDSGEHHLGLHTFDPHSQSHPVTSDMSGAGSLQHINAANVIKQQEKQYKGKTSPGNFFETCCIQVPSKQQTSLDSKSDQPVGPSVPPEVSPPLLSLMTYSWC